MIKLIISSLLAKKKKLPFIFKIDKTLLDHNVIVLKKYRYDLEKVIKDHKDNIISLES